MRLNPRDRLKCDQILTHPWMIGVSARKARTLKTILPPLCPRMHTVQQWTDALKRDAPDEVLSPFERVRRLERDRMSRSVPSLLSEDGPRTLGMSSRSGKLARTLDRKGTFLPVSAIKGMKRTIVSHQRARSFWESPQPSLM
jgi:hypothetical protein